MFEAENPAPIGAFVGVFLEVYPEVQGPSIAFLRIFRYTGFGILIRAE